MEGSVAEYQLLGMDALLDKVYREGGYDFRQYKRGTIYRRLVRRLYHNALSSCEGYASFLDAHPEEYRLFAEEVTIKASGFFRTAHAFKRFSEIVLPELFPPEGSHGVQKLSFWSAACACGEEPYSIAISLLEHLGARRDSYDITIYASDISVQALERAAEGIYTGNQLERMPGHLLSRYFHRNGEGFKVIPEVKDMVTLLPFDLASAQQVPFGKIDCIFCCNVLIYFQKALQERVLHNLCLGLGKPGYLVLGEVESPGANMRDVLTCLDGKARIYLNSAR